MAKENFNGYGPTPGDKSKSKFFVLIGFFVLFIGILAFSSGTSDDVQTPAAETDSNSKTQESTAGSSYKCSAIHTDITMIRSAFAGGEITPQQMSLLLEAASSDWLSASAQSTGAESDWLAKMSELSLKLESFILTGSPANGGQLLDQLNNNMDLVSQFCE